MVINLNHKNRVNDVINISKPGQGVLTFHISSEMEYARQIM